MANGVRTATNVVMPCSLFSWSLSWELNTHIHTDIHTQTFILGEESARSLLVLAGGSCVDIEGGPSAGGDDLANDRTKVPLLWGSLHRQSGIHKGHEIE